MAKYDCKTCEWYTGAGQRGCPDGLRGYDCLRHGQSFYQRHRHQDTRDAWNSFKAEIEKISNPLLLPACKVINGIIKKLKSKVYNG
jgi:hypothetical protein